MKKILVVMSCFNGEKYIQEQIDSILSQIDVDVTLMIRDDGSNDRTPEILKHNAEMHNNIKLELGENIGFRRSFYDTLMKTRGDYDYYSFADQDDVWEKDKLIRAVNMLENDDNDIKLYASALRVVDSELNFMYLNEFKGIRINYGSALSRQRIAGCTMVFNRNLYQMCKKFRITEEMGNLFSHDGAVYYICLVCGGKVIFDSESRINFRRHDGTVTEHGKGFLKRVSSVTNIFGKYKNKRTNQAKMLNDIFSSYMPDEIQEISDKILCYRESFRKTLSLMNDKRINSGIRSVDFINKLAVLFHCY